MSGHVWYVTGAASGLGKATATRIVKAGGLVAALDMNEVGALVTGCRSFDS